MSALPQIADLANEQDFEFDYDHNAIHFKGERIHLTPREADIIHVLLNNRARTTPLGVLIQRVYGASEPETAAIAIRVAIHSLRKKLRDTGIKIKAEAHVGYEIDADAVPSLNRRLSDKILIAINTAKASGEHAIAARLQIAYDLAEARRQEYRAAHGERPQDVIKTAEPIPPPQDVIAPAR